MDGETAATVLQELYAAFNARRLDTLLAAMTDDVDWPNAWEGGRVVGHDGVPLVTRGLFASLSTHD